MDERIFFTSDTHFGHANIIKYCNRPFSDVEEMDRAMISRWNECVRPHDTVYHLGDFCFGGPENADRYFRSLNGLIHVIAVPWHHDRSWLPRDLDNPDYVSKQGHSVWLHLCECLMRNYEYGDDKYPKSIHMSHYPLASWEAKFHGGWHLYGHVHNNPFEALQGPALNVGVDVNDFRPVSLEYVASYCQARTRSQTQQETGKR